MVVDVAEWCAQIEDATCSARRREPAPGRAELIAALFQRHNKVLLWYLKNFVATADDAADIAQEAYLRLLTVEQLDDDGGRARNYLFKTATNLALDAWRRRSRRERLHVALETLEADCGGWLPEALVDSERALDVVHAILDELRPRARMAFVLHWYKEMGYREIAGRLDVSKKTVERDIALTIDLCRSRLEARLNG